MYPTILETQFKNASINSRKPSILRGSIALFVSAASLLTLSQSKAATLYWDINDAAANVATAATGAWNGTSAFWNPVATGTGGTLTAATTAADDLFFSSGSVYTAGTITLSAARLAHSVSFDDNIAMILASGGLTLGSATAGSGVFVLSSSNQANTISSPITLAGDSTLQTAGTGVLSITGGVTGTFNVTLANNSTNGAGVTVATTSLNNTGTVTNSGTGVGGTLISTSVGANVSSVIQNSTSSALSITGGIAARPAGVTLSSVAGSAGFTIATGAISGTGLVTKSGAGTVTINSVIGTGTGGLQVSAGTLVVGGAANTFTGGVSINGATAVLQMTSGSNGNATSAPLGIVSGGTAYKTISIDNGGTFRPMANYNVNVPTAALPGNGYVFSIGANGGVFDVPTGVTFTLDDGAGAGTALTNTQLQGSGTLVKTGSGVLLLGNGGGSNAVFTGQILVNQGILRLGPLTAAGVGLGSTSANTVIASGAGFDINNNASTAAEPVTISGTGVLGGNAIFTSHATGGSFSGPITLAAPSQIGSTGAGTLTFNAGSTFALGANNLTIANAGAGRVFTDGVISGTGGVIVNGVGTGDYVPRTAHTYSGTTTLTAGFVAVDADSAGPAGSPTAGAFGTGLLNLAGAQMRSSTGVARTVGNTVTISADTTFFTLAAEKSLIFSGPVTLTGGTRTLTSTVGNTVAGTSVVFDGAIGDGGSSFGLTKAGTGNITLSGQNTFTGPTTINAGRLTYKKNISLYSNNPASWTATNITVATGATMMLSVGGVNEFSASDVATISSLGTPTGGFQSGATLGLDTTSGNFTLGSTIANANAINLLKLGANSLSLDAANTYTGTTTIQGGTVFANGSSTTSQINISGGTNTTLQVTNPSATGTGSINFATGATTPSLLFRLDGGGNIPLPNSLIGNSGITSTIDVNNNGSGTNGVVQLNGTPATGLGNVNLNVTGGNGYSLYIASIFSSAGSSGTTLVNPTTANVSFGTISSIVNAFAYNWQFDGTTTGNAVTGAISNGSGTLSVTKSNTSTWTLSGNNTYTGATNVNAGTLVLSGSNSGTGATTVAGGVLQLDYSTQDNSKLADLAVLTLGGGTIDLKGGSHTEIVGSTTLAANTFSRVTRSTPGSVLQMGTITRNGTASIDFAASGIASTDNPNVNGILGTWATVGGTDWASNSASPASGLITTPVYTDVQRQTAGIITDGFASNVRIVEGTGGNSITLGAATTTINTLNQSANGGSSAATIDPNGQTLATNAILVGAGAGALTVGTGVNNGTLTSANASGDLALVNNTANTLLIRSVIADNVNSTLTKLGNGSLTLTGANTYAGATNLTAGTLILGSASAIGFGTLTFSGGSLDSSVVNLVNANNNAQAWNADFTFVGTQNLDLGTGAVTLSGNRQITVAANTLTIGGDVGGAFGLTKTGDGTLTLNGANLYTGLTTVSRGALSLTGNRTTAAGGFVVGNLGGSTGTLNVADGTFNTGTVTLGLGSGTSVGIINQSGGTLTLTGTQLIIGNGGSGGTLAGNGGFGTYNLSGGTLTATSVANRGVMLGTNDGGTATFNLSGGSLSLTGALSQLMVGRSDSPVVNTTNLFNQTGGTATVSILTIGGATAAASGLNSTFSVTGGTFSAASFTSFAVGNSGNATINIGGTAEVTLPAFPTVHGIGTTTTINFDGGTLRSAAASATYMGGLTNAFIKAGGARFDTSGGSVTITQNLLTDAISTGGGLTKQGANTLTLTGLNTYTGKTTVTAGGLTFNTIGDVGAGASALGAPTTVAEGTIDLDGTLTYTGAAASTNRVINLNNPTTGSTVNNSGTGVLTLNGSVTGGNLNLLYRGAGNITMTGLIPATHTGPVSHTDAGTLTLTNPNNAWTGALVVSNGVVSVDTIANQGVPSAIGAGTLITLGQTGFNNTGALQFTGAFGGSSDRNIDIQSNGTSGNGGVIENAVAGQLLNLSGDITVGGTGTLPSLRLTGAGNGLLTGNIIGSPALAVTKTGPGTWTMSGANTYTRNTTVDQGTLAFATDQSLAGGLVFGATVGGTNSSTLDLSAGSGSFASLLVQTNSATTSTVTVGSGKTFAINGNMTVGYDAGTGATGALLSRLKVGGDGSMLVTGTTITIGVNQAGAVNQAFWNDATLDVTALSAFSANVTSINIGVGGQTQGPGTLLLSDTANLIVATTVTAGDTGGNNGRGTGLIQLGSGTNVVQADTINVGRGKGAGSRTGVVKFASQTVGSPGTVVITDKAGTSAANITVGDNNGTVTAGGATGTLDLSGHVATVTANTLLIGRNNMASNTGAVDGVLSFDAGTFTVSALSMAPKTGAGTGAANATLNIGGGNFTVNSGGSFTLGSQATAGSSVATLNLTGGTFTSNVDIVAGTGTTNSTVTVNGGTLDMTGKNLGGATVIDSLNLQSGKLKNVGQINNGGAISKTTTGTLTMEGANSYTGVTNVVNGTLNINGTIGTGANVVNANGGTTNFGVSQTLSALNIGNGAVVTLSEAAAAPAPEFDLGLLGDASAGIGAGDALVNPAGVAAVPEPGSVALLFGGMLALLGVRRRKNG